MVNFRSYIEKIVAISDKDWELFSSKLENRVFKKRSILLEVGETENHISFIESGVVRLYIPKENPEKEITFGFSFKNQFISAYDSFLTQKRLPSSLPFRSYLIISSSSKSNKVKSFFSILNLLTLSKLNST